MAPMTVLLCGVNLLVRFNISARSAALFGQQSVRFKRGFLRKPLSVIPPSQEDNEIGDNYTDFATNYDKIPPSRPTSASCGIIPPYEKLGENDAKFTSLISLAKSKKMREEHGKILLEGRRLIKDAIEAGVPLDSIYFSKEENLSGLPLDKISNLKLYKVFYKQMCLWSDLTTSPGIMGVFKRPKSSMLKLQRGQFPVTVICDNIREPGNLGAILRCVTAAGCKRILLSKGCTDVWEPKVLRGGAGAHFRIEIQNNIPWELMRNYYPEDAVVYLACNEASAESGNVFSPAPDITDMPFYDVTTEGDKIDQTYLDEQRLHSYKNVKLPVILYHQIVTAKDRETIVIVGGETEGLSAAAYKCAYDCGGCKVQIPLMNDVESLNVAVAAGIILFQIKGQHLQSDAHVIENKLFNK